MNLLFHLQLYNNAFFAGPMSGQETRPISDVIHTADEQIKLFRKPLCLCFLGFHDQCLLLIMRVLRTRQWRQHGHGRW